MTIPPEPGVLEALPSNDHRPNSGLREGGVTHARVNEEIRFAPKTVIFGQQTRLRLGLLMEDETLPRFHAGHDMVKFFYGAIRQIPDIILDAILAAGISVTLIRERNLLAYEDVRAHQSFHTGRTRRTIYMPEQVLAAAFDAGYDYWALSEVIIQEAWPLLDYVLILELVRHVQVKLRQVNLPGISFIKDTTRALNKHLKDPSATLRAEGRFFVDPKEDEFMLFYGHYGPRFLEWGRDILDRDPFDMVDEIFDEGVERQWAAWKVDLITHTFNYPTFFQLDRDIVHPAAFELAEKYGQPVAPITVEEVIHDLSDVARFRQGRQVKTDPLLDQLIDAGAPGILAFADAVARERATNHLVITDYYFDGYHTVSVFRQKLQDWARDLPPDMDMGGKFDSLSDALVLIRMREAFEQFRLLPASDQGDWRLHLRSLVFQLIGVHLSKLSDAEKELMLTTPAHFGPGQQVSAWLELAEQFLPEDETDTCNALVVTILSELRRHPQYHGLFLEQVRELSASEEIDFGANLRDQVAQIEKLVPEQPYKLSSDPQALHRRLDAFRRLLQDDPDSAELLTLAAGVLIRLDEAENYAELVGVVHELGSPATPALEEIMATISPRDERRVVIRRMAERLLEGAR
ncbi:MAG: hypothetical protein HN712_03600 [Gemmatimonadetes bacterium]|jgi:hypothetical protein|nr:hypothetical protein [Gemmatimonadota bacterium]MBT6144282.1 hypothetical protein [Gemmatimonadota bacterium]MBT7859365.1 hypothetical protein [Gemmatimonadota bacterium]